MGIVLTSHFFPPPLTGTSYYYREYVYVILKMSQRSLLQTCYICS